MESSTGLCFKHFGGGFGLCFLGCLFFFFLFLLSVGLFGCFTPPQSVHQKGSHLISPSYSAFHLAFNCIMNFEGSLRE